MAAFPGRGDIGLLSSPSVSRDSAMEILTSGEIMADFFRTRLSRLFPQGSTLKGCRPEVLKDRLGSRQVVSYRFFFADDAQRDAGHKTVILKRYADKTEGKNAQFVMENLWKSGFNHQSMFRIPEPICYLEELGLQVQERAQGMLLRNNLSRSGPVAQARMRAAARWLARLHQLDADFAEIPLHPDDETTIRDFVQRTGGREAHLLPELEELAALLLTRLSSFGECSATLVHGDFQCENVFVDRGRVTVVDFDRFCRSDPARDLGYMIAQARTIGFLREAPPEAVHLGLKAFWEEYNAGVPIVERESLSARTCVFAARKCLQNIFYMVYVLGGARAETVSALLHEAGRFARAERVEEVLVLPLLPRPQGG